MKSGRQVAAKATAVSGPMSSAWMVPVTPAYSTSTLTILPSTAPSSLVHSKPSDSIWLTLNTPSSTVMPCENSVPSAIHVTPEAFCGGLLAKVRDGDPVRIDARAGLLELAVGKEELARREWVEPNLDGHRTGMGRQIFAPLRSNTMGADEGASALFTYVHERCSVTPFTEGE